MEDKYNFILEKQRIKKSNNLNLVQIKTGKIHVS